MATTSYLYHTLGLKGYVHQRTDYRGGGVFHHVELAPHKRRCRNCSARWNRLQLQGCFQRCIRTLPVATRHQFVVLHGHRQSCSQCGQTLREPIAFAQGKRRYTNAFAQYVVQLCRIATIKAVARLLGVGWDLVKEIHKEHLGQRLKKRKLSQLRYLAIDEFATHSGHLYMTVVLDLESGQIVSLHEGKDAQALVACLRHLKGRCKSLRAIAIDMSDAYRKAIRQVFAGKVDVVHDPYHVVALANQAIDQTRRSMMRKLETGRKQLLKGTRFLLLRGLENLNERSLEHLMQLMEINEPLYQAYLLKEAAQQFFCNFRVGCGTGSSSLGSRVQKAVAREPLAVNLSKATSRSIKMRGRSSLHYSQRAIQRPHLLLQEKRPCQKPSEPRSRAAPYREPSLI